MAAYIPYMIASDIVDYVNTNIKPLYEQESTGHDWEHIKNVMINMSHLRQSIENDTGSIDDGTFSIQNCYLAVVYHDISLTDPRNSRDTHDQDSAQIFEYDQFIRANIHPKSIERIADAIRKHRASSGKQDRTTLGKLLFQADRGFITMTPEDVFKRSFTFHSKDNTYDTYPEISIKALKHMINKYGDNGYAYDNIYFPQGVAEFKAKMKVFLDEAKLLFGDKLD